MTINFWMLQYFILLLSSSTRSKGIMIHVKESRNPLQFKFPSVEESQTCGCWWRPHPPTTKQYLKEAWSWLALDAMCFSNAHPCELVDMDIWAWLLPLTAGLWDVPNKNRWETYQWLRALRRNHQQSKGMTGMWLWHKPLGVVACKN